MTATLPPLFKEVEYKADKPDAVEQHTGAMIALRPRQDHIDRLALDDGEAPEELHTTILFLGKAADYSYDTRARIINAMREVALKNRFVTGDGFGVNAWNANGESPCIVLGVGGKEMVGIYNDIVSALQGFDLLQMPEQHEPWMPHVTLKYTDDFSEVESLTELQGEIVYDAIRVAFGGIVDDIPLQPAASGGDGYVSGNRYENIPGGGMKTQRVPKVEIPWEGVEQKIIEQDESKCKFCNAKATRIVTGDNEKKLYTCVEHTDDADEWFDANTDVDGTHVEQKAVRHVRTAAGVRRYGQPIGSVIVGDGVKLNNLKEERSEYDGYNKYSVDGTAIYTRKEGSEYVAYDAQDRVINRDTREEALLRALDRSGAAAKKVKAAGGDKAPAHPKYKNFVRQNTDYPGYEKYKAPNGDAVYFDPADNTWWDENDNPLSGGDLSKMNSGGKSATKERLSGTPYGFKPAESEYPGYDKFTGKNGVAVYRDQKDNTFWDENDNEIRDVSKYADTTVADVTPERTSNLSPSQRAKAERMIAEREAQGAKKPMTRSESRNVDKVDDGNGPRPDEVDEPKSGSRVEPAESDSTASKRPAGQSRRNSSGKAATRSDSGPKPNADNTPRRGDDPRGSLVGSVTAQEDLDKVMARIGGSKKPSDSDVEELRRVAMRQVDVRNRRRLMLYAQQLGEQKVFASLTEMDPWLRAIALEVKLITPGGRVGSDRSLGSRTNGRNWVERTPMGRLPKYIRIVANGIKGHSKSRRIALAVAAMKRWARGGGNVTAPVQAAAAKALAEWEALKAAA